VFVYLTLEAFQTIRICKFIKSYTLFAGIKPSASYPLGHEGFASATDILKKKKHVKNEKKCRLKFISAYTF